MKVLIDIQNKIYIHIPITNNICQACRQHIFIVWEEGIFKKMHKYIKKISGC